MCKVTPEMRNLSGLNQLTGNDEIIKDKFISGERVKDGTAV